MNWSFLKINKKDKTLQVKETFTISNINISGEIYKLPESLEFSVNSTIEQVYRKVLAVLCEKFLEKKEEDNDDSSEEA